MTPIVAVLRGGPSEEHHVSLLSGIGVLEALKQTGYSTLDVIITQGGTWTVGGAEIDPKKLPEWADVAFLALHGTYGEDGQLQTFLDTLQVPYTGSNAASSALAFDKVKTKEKVQSPLFSFAPSIVVQLNQNYKEQLEHFLGSTEQVVLKPSRSGSSFGVVICKGDECRARLQADLNKYQELLLEKRITGTEVTCGVMEVAGDLKPLPVVEIIPPEGASFFDLDVKYNGRTREICPASISDELTKRVQDAAVYAHQALGLAQYSRSDFILGNNGELYFLETNTLPGLTKESLLPKEILAAGMTYEQFIDQVVTQALLKA